MSARCLVTWLLSLALVSACTPEPAEAIGDRATVVAVIDGDTVALDFGAGEERARLIGIDTPESVSPDCPRSVLWSQASEATKGLLPPGTEVRVARDSEPETAMAVSSSTSIGLTMICSSIAG
ncbi:MAG: hypothetical protein R2706_01425 [Acidimicrobiales bacterium]